MTFEQGELILYQSDDGKAAVDVRLSGETVWLTLNQMSELFGRDKSVISRHLRNIFQTGELDRSAVIAKNATTAADGKTYQMDYYDFDAIISVGYRVNSKRGTQFRIWATRVLKEHLVQGYTFNQRRLAEKGLGEARQVLALLANTLESHNLVNDEGQAVLHIVQQYARTWRLLWQYDEDSLILPERKEQAGITFQLDAARQAIATLRKDLMTKGEATDIFGNEGGDGLAGILGAIQQTFGGQDLYSSVEEKAAHLLYFVIKDHPFTDGNKRIGSFLFLYFLQINDLLNEQSFDNKALVALTLLIAASNPKHKDLLIRLIINLLAETEEGS
ncbi:MAG: virulence protein RhuM/Fic/DOC family protein [Desulfosarcina sp.]|nr:virulence protein RhuM/Fic/DOC family protein [Desulfosarcina sp.]